MKKRSVLYIYIIAAIIALAVIAGIFIRGQIIRYNALKKAPEALKKYETLFPEKIRDYYDMILLPVPGTISGKAVTDFQRASYSTYEYECYEASIVTALTLYVKQDFENLTRYDKYRALQTWYNLSTAAKSRFMEEEVPELLPGNLIGDVTKHLSIIEKGYLWPDYSGCRYVIVSPEHRYEYADNVEDYYIMDDEEIYLRYPGRVWDTSGKNASSSGSSASNPPVSHGTAVDPYDTAGYSDPEVPVTVT